ncbi:MAG TPA: YHS domain protein [Rhodobacteraceae bacterium]|nr:YHS domain protein [Paracoccaceae bacterium]
MATRRAFLTLVAATPLAGTIGRPLQAATPEVFNTDGLAVHGADVVAYFRDARPVDGRPEFAVKWHGALWRFASAENMEAFEMNPHAYAPRYGGYCAYAMAQGAIATTVPEAWSIHEGKLYLNFSTGVRRIWRKNIPGYIEAADKFWPGILSN